MALLGSASLPLANLDKSDIAIRRLVAALQHHQPAQESAAMSTVLEGESRPYVSLPGQNHFVLGLPIGLTSGTTSGAFGLSIGWSYETERWRVEATGLGTGTGNGSAILMGFSGAYYFFPGEWSPYVGGGVGYMWTWSQATSGGGAGLTAEAGVELLRLNHTHLLVSLESLIPAYALTPYAPYFLFQTRLAF